MCVRLVSFEGWLWLVIVEWDFICCDIYLLSFVHALKGEGGKFPFMRSFQSRFCALCCSISASSVPGTFF